MTSTGLLSKRITLGVTGSIAAYKACELSRLLVKRGAQVQVVMTKSALEFVGAATFAGLGVGLYADVLQAGRRLARIERTVAPDPDAHARYGEIFARWREVYVRSLPLVEDGLLRPLWRAAGT